jgi:hypothetical protein
MFEGASILGSRTSDCLSIPDGAAPSILLLTGETGDTGLKVLCSSTF